mmetsp:Transcript_15637/g.62965  ORF Transcript_15637/g.62965 Transcript_15637/m.62965 type:complete len:259 (+) Transcript_15637:840-1616(+)
MTVARLVVIHRDEGMEDRLNNNNNNPAVSDFYSEVPAEDFGELDLVDKRDSRRQVDAGRREVRRDDEGPLAADAHPADALLDALAEDVLEGPRAVLEGDGFFVARVVDDAVADLDDGLEADDVARERRLAAAADEDVGVPQARGGLHEVARARLGRRREERRDDLAALDRRENPEHGEAAEDAEPPRERARGAQHGVELVEARALVARRHQLRHVVLPRPHRRPRRLWRRCRGCCLFGRVCLGWLGAHDDRGTTARTW